MDFVCWFANNCKCEILKWKYQSKNINRQSLFLKIETYPCEKIYRLEHPMPLSPIWMELPLDVWLLILDRLPPQYTLFFSSFLSIPAHYKFKKMFNCPPERTSRGFSYINFEDEHQNQCVIQKSSNYIPQIYLGIEDRAMQLDCTQARLIRDFVNMAATTPISVCSKSSYNIL